MTCSFIHILICAIYAKKLLTSSDEFSQIESYFRQYYPSIHSEYKTAERKLFLEVSGEALKFGRVNDIFKVLFEEVEPNAEGEGELFTDYNLIVDDIFWHYQFSKLHLN